MSARDERVNAAAEALWDALDAVHDNARHVHAAECCWPFLGAMDALDDTLAALADDPAQALARVEAVAKKFETWPDVGDAFGPRWIGQQLRAALAGGPTVGSEQ